MPATSVLRIFDASASSAEEDMLRHALFLAALATGTLAAHGDGDWKAAYAKADAALAKLSNQNKVDLATGIGWTAGPCVGNTAAIPSIGYPELCLQDSPLG